MEKYNPDNLFKKKNKSNKTMKVEENNLQMIEYKENIFKKIINKIKMFWSNKSKNPWIQVKMLFGQVIIQDKRGL